MKREWFTGVSDAFLADGTLLASSDGNTSFRPAPMAASAAGLPRQLGDLELLGRFLGLALIQQVTVGVRLHPLVCKLLLRNGEAWEWTHDDVQSLDPLLYKHKVQYVLENPVDALCLNFTDVLHDAAADDAGGDATPAESVELVPGGEEIEVTDENKGEWVRAVCEWRLFGCNRAQCAALLKGVHAAYPSDHRAARGAHCAGGPRGHPRRRAHHRRRRLGGKRRVHRRLPRRARVPRGAPSAPSLWRSASNCCNS